MTKGLLNFFQKSKFWERDDLFFCTPIDIEQLNLSEQDADLFCAGIPAWAAPNMHLFLPEIESEGLIAFGEDRDDRKIILSISSGEVFVTDKLGMIYVSSSFRNFLSQVVYYAEMVDEALNINGRNALIDNNIPESCINEFEHKVFQIDSTAVSVQSFWSQELERLRSHDDK